MISFQATCKDNTRLTNALLHICENLKELPAFSGYPKLFLLFQYDSTHRLTQGAKQLEPAGRSLPPALALG